MIFFFFKKVRTCMEALERFGDRINFIQTFRAFLSLVPPWCPPFGTGWVYYHMISSSPSLSVRSLHSIHPYPPSGCSRGAPALKMPHFHLRLSFPLLPCFHFPSTILQPAVSYEVQYTHFRHNISDLDSNTYVVKRIRPLYTCSSSSLRLHRAGLEISVDVKERSIVTNYLQPTLALHSTAIQTVNEKAQVGGYHDSPESLCYNKEKSRKRKKKHGNRGKIPWNKGRKHSAETCALIKQRTIEALKDPQVRRKMSQHPLPHSDVVKKKISSSLRKVWSKRLKWKRLKEKFFLSWAKSVAEAAKKGGSDKQELDWHSYDKIKEEMIIQQFQPNEDNAKAKELPKMIVGSVTQAKAKMKVKLAQKKKQREDKTKMIEKAKQKAQRKSKKNAEPSLHEELTLKQRLTKIRRKNSRRQLEALISHSQAWEKLDLKLLKREKLPKEVSLAEQILSVKSNRAESMTTEAFAPSAGINRLCSKLYLV